MYILILNILNCSYDWLLYNVHKCSVGYHLFKYNIINSRKLKPWTMVIWPFRVPCDFVTYYFYDRVTNP